ncbi:MAG: prolyl oligopeptidase family serine peptidase [Gemmatimonadota bacterium]|nr:prolyl oligopeptidase family serine peptidase [Gemmatimonadota bacterium]
MVEERRGPGSNRAFGRTVVPRVGGVLAVAAALNGMTTPAAAQGRAGERSTLEASTYLTEVDIDDDGDRLAWVEVDMGASPPSSTVFLAGAGRTGVRVGSGRAVSFRPGAPGLAWLAAGADGLEIRIADGAGTATDTVSAPGGVREFQWSPNGARIAFAAPMANGEAGATGLFVHDFDEERTRPIAVAGGTVHTDPFGAGGSFAWSPDGRQLAFAVQPEATVEGSYAADIFVADLTGETTRPVVRRPGLDIRPTWSPDGAHLAFATSFGAVDRFAAHGLAIVHVATGRVEDVGRDLDGTFLETPSGHRWTADGAGILVVRASGVFTDLVRLDAATGSMTPLTGEGGTVAVPRFDEDARTAVYLRSDPGTPWTIRRLDLVSGAITAVGPETTGPTRRWEVFRWNVRDADSLEGLLVTPDSASAEPPPLVVWLHGGPDGRSAAAYVPAVPFPTPPFDPMPLEALLDAGFAVFLPNDRPSAGYPASVRRSVAGRSVEALEADVMSGVDALVEAGRADADRLYLGGWASGGLRADQLLTRTGRFRAAVSGAGNTALAAAYGDGDFTVQWRSIMGGAPWENRRAWDAASPLRNAPSITTPLLLLHGAADPLVPVDHSRYLFTHLEQLGRTVELEVLEGVGHGIMMPRDRAGVAERILDWFRRHP